MFSALSIGHMFYLRFWLVDRTFTHCWLAQGLTFIFVCWQSLENRRELIEKTSQATYPQVVSPSF